MRYEVVFDTYGYWVIDTLIEDGEPCNIAGAFTRSEAQAKCDQLNTENTNE